MEMRIDASRGLPKGLKTMGYGKSKSGGFVGNLSKLGGGKRKLALKTDMRDESMPHGSLKKASKQAHKRV
jgi:hypothetical protein